MGQTNGWTIPDWQAAYYDGARASDLLANVLDALTEGDSTVLNGVDRATLKWWLAELEKQLTAADGDLCSQPLYGAPFVVKDNIDTSGFETTAACLEFAYCPTQDAFVGHPRGWVVFQQLIAYMRRRQQRAGYVEVNTPDVMDRSLWETSGHWQNYRDHMFTTDTDDGRSLALKPMNCPGSVVLYRHGLKSYRDLPIRMGEFGKVHRYEPSGALHGLLRVRHFTQDDAHIYCTPAQMDAECREVVALVLDIYRQFGFDDVYLKLSTRPDSRMGSDAIWDRLEGALVQALQDSGLDYQLNPGEGAFYGPKLEFVLRDAIGRDWQCGTLQVDMNLPERFGIEYMDEDGQRQRPVLLHRALFGSLERFTGILIEHHAGKLPAWLVSVQAMVLSITDAHAAYAQDVAQWLCDAGLRVETDLRNEKVGYKIREQTLQRIPFLLVVGASEAAAGQVALRSRDGRDLATQPG